MICDGCRGGGEVCACVSSHTPSVLASPLLSQSRPFDIPFQKETSTSQQNLSLPRPRNLPLSPRLPPFFRQTKRMPTTLSFRAGHGMHTLLILALWMIAATGETFHDSEAWAIPCATAFPTTPDVAEMCASLCYTRRCGPQPNLEEGEQTEPVSAVCRRLETIMHQSRQRQAALDSAALAQSSITWTEGQSVIGTIFGQICPT